MRRAAARAAPVPATSLEAGGLSIERDSREVRLEGEKVDLTDREFDLLLYLASSPRKVFSRNDLLRDVWGSAPEWQSPKTVTEHVHRLRRKLERNPRQPRLIVTVGTAGYRFDPRESP